jgi:hypothetical protein
MPRKRKEPVEKVCDNCGAAFETRLPSRARFCPGSKCRSEAWNVEHRVESKEEFAREAVRAYWRRTKRAWRESKRVSTPEGGGPAERRLPSDPKESQVLPEVSD